MSVVLVVGWSGWVPAVSGGTAPWCY